MRIAYVAPIVRFASQLDPNPLTVERIIAVAKEHDIVVFVDQQSPGSEALQDVDVIVVIAPKRPLDIDGSLIGSDGMQARQLASLHRDVPFDEIWYSGDHMVDLGWHESILSDVRQLIVAPSVALQGASHLFGEGVVPASAATLTWASVGRLAAADGIISDAPLGSLGLRGVALPPVRPLVGSPVRDEEFPRAPSLVVIVAAFGHVGAIADAISSAVSRIGNPAATTVAVLHAQRNVGAEPLGSALRTSLPTAVERSTIFVPLADDGVAASFMDRADAIVCATEADLTFPRVADRAQIVPTAVIAPIHGDGGHRDGRVTGDPPVAREVEAGQPVGEALSEIGGDEHVVLYQRRHGDLAARLSQYGRVILTDVTLVSAPDGIYGGVTDVIDDGIACFGPRMMRSIRRAGSQMTLDQVIRHLFDPVNPSRLSLQLLPAEGAGSFAAQWVEGLEAPAGSLGPFAGPAAVAVQQLVETEDSQPPRAWVESLGWKDRAKLILPWKWGLLSKAMKGRW